MIFMDFLRHFSDVGGRSQGAVRSVGHEFKVTNVRYLATTVDHFITVQSLLMLGLPRLPLLFAFNQQNRDITQNHLWWWINFRLWELCLLSLRSWQANFSLPNIMHEIWKATWRKFIRCLIRKPSEMFAKPSERNFEVPVSSHRQTHSNTGIDFTRPRL